MTQRKPQKKKGRLHLRVEADLAAQMHDYAKRHSTNVTALTTKYFLELLAAENLAAYPEAEQV